MTNQQITSFEHACQILGRSTALPEVSMLDEKHQKAIIAHYKLVIICQALNEGWEPNWHDDDEYKWYPWFDMDIKEESGSGLAFCGADRAYSYSSLGSRLCVKSEELAEYLGQTFIDLYRDYFLL